MNRAIEAGAHIGVPKEIINPAIFKNASQQYLKPENIDPSKTTYIEGFKIWLEMHAPAPKKKPTDEVAIHEAQHAAFGAKKATIVADSESLGSTEPLDGEINPIQAVAPAAAGGKGTGHDLNLVRQMGYSPESLFGAARSELAKREDDVNAIALGLEEHGTLTSSGIEKAIFEYKRPKPQTGIMHITTSGGEYLTQHVEVRDNIVMTDMEENVWVQLAKRSTNSQIH